MKTLTLIIAMLTVFTSVQAISSTTTNSDEKDEKVEKVKIKVKSVWMKNKEAKALQAEIAELEGIEEVYVCPIRSKAIIEYNPEKVKVDDMTEIIEEEGYDFKL